MAQYDFIGFEIEGGRLYAVFADGTRIDRGPAPSPAGGGGPGTTARAGLPYYVEGGLEYVAPAADVTVAFLVDGVARQAYVFAGMPAAAVAEAVNAQIQAGVVRKGSFFPSGETLVYQGTHVLDFRGASPEAQRLLCLTPDQFLVEPLDQRDVALSTDDVADLSQGAAVGAVLTRTLLTLRDQGDAFAFRLAALEARVAALESGGVSSALTTSSNESLA